MEGVAFIAHPAAFEVFLLARDGDEDIGFVERLVDGFLVGRFPELEEADVAIEGVDAPLRELLEELGGDEGVFRRVAALVAVLEGDEYFVLFAFHVTIVTKASRWKKRQLAG